MTSISDDGLRLFVLYEDDESAEAQEEAAQQAHIQVFCERFATVAPEAFLELMRVATAIGQINAPVTEVTDQVRALVTSTSSEVSSWTQKHNLEEIWAGHVVVQTLLAYIFPDQTSPETLVHASTTYDQVLPDGTRRRFQVPKELDVQIAIELPDLTYTWTPVEETPGDFRRRVMADIGKRLDVVISKRSPVKVNTNYIDWTIDHRVNGSSINGLARRLEVDRSSIQYGIETVEKLLFPSNPSLRGGK